jgi:hypothetical protein
MRADEAGFCQGLDLQHFAHFLQLCGQCVYSFRSLKKYAENPMG